MKKFNTIEKGDFHDVLGFCYFHCFKIWLYFWKSYFILIDNKTNTLPRPNQKNFLFVKNSNHGDYFRKTFPWNIIDSVLIYLVSFWDSDEQIDITEEKISWTLSWCVWFVLILIHLKISTCFWKWLYVHNQD